MAALGLGFVSLAIAVGDELEPAPQRNRAVFLRVGDDSLKHMFGKLEPADAQRDLGAGAAGLGLVEMASAGIDTPGMPAAHSLRAIYIGSAVILRFRLFGYIEMRCLPYFLGQY